jgi:hypothetical protein
VVSARCCASALESAARTSAALVTIGNRINVPLPPSGSVSTWFARDARCSGA